MIAQAFKEFKSRNRFTAFTTLNRKQVSKEVHKSGIFGLETNLSKLRINC